MATKLINQGTKTVHPLKSIADIQALHHYLLDKAFAASTPFKRNLHMRNWLYYGLGINLSLRGGDISSLTWDQLVNHDPDTNTWSIRVDEYNTINAEKTGKVTLVFANAEARNYIDFYLQITQITPTAGTYVFPSRKSGHHIDCDEIGRILKKAVKECGINVKNFCTHSLRKTFGYQHYSEHQDIVTLQKIFGHSNPGITLAYIGMDTETIMNAMEAKPDTSIDLTAYGYVPTGDMVITTSEVKPNKAISNIVHFPTKTTQFQAHFKAKHHDHLLTLART